MEATGSGGGGGMEDLTGQLRSNDERSLYICSMDFNNVSVSYAIHSIKLSDLFSSSCSCRFDPDLPTNSNPTAIGDPDLPTNRDPSAIGGDGDRSKCPWCSKCPSCSKSLKAPDEEDCSELNHPSEEDCSELNHPDDTTTRTKCAACSKGNSELCYQASLTGESLPADMSCGVFGSQIVLAGGVKFNTTPGPLKRGLFSSSCSCSFDPVLPTNPKPKPKPNPNPTAIGHSDLPLNPTAIAGDGDRSKCPCLSSLKAPDEEYCCELNHPDDTTTRTACAACSKGNSDLCYRASLTGEFLPAVMGCGVFGSQIVFAGGLKFNITTVDGPLKRRFGPDASSAVYGFETRDPNPTIKMSGRDRMFGEMFGKGICHPLLVEVSGKLYALARKEEFFSVSEPTYFQVFDPNFKKWSPLPAPPILEKGHISSSSLAIMGNFILMSTPNIPMVYGFDTENDAGWIEIGTPRFFCGRSLPFKGKALVVADNNGYFLFTFGSAIIVHFIGADHGQVIKELPLPQDVPVEFRKPNEPLYHRFIQLEGQKVCLVMTICTIEKLRVMVLTFEFSPPDVKHVHTRYFNCDITSSTMIGAFVL